MTKIYDSIVDTIGNTPMVKAPVFMKGISERVYFKLESFNPMASVKDRIALSMIEDAQKKGIIHKDTVLVEPTSGNTGIGLAFVCAAKQIPLILTMPDTMSVERRKILQALGAKLILTPGTEGMKGAIARAEEIQKTTPYALLLGQFSNPANPEIHERTTAQEIWSDSDGKIDVFVTGVGTGGTITGCARFFKRKNKEIQIIAVEPKDSPVLTQTLKKQPVQPGPHKIQGIGAGFVPALMDISLVDEVIQVSNELAFSCARELCRGDGMMVGISSGAVAYAARELAKRPQNRGKHIVAVLASHGERYLSTPLYDFETPSIG